MRDVWAELEDRGARALVITFATPDRLEDFRAYLRLPYPVTADPERLAYAAYGMTRGSFFRIWGARSAWAYLTLVLRGRTLQKPTRGDDLSQLGGDFVIDPGGRLRYVHVSRDPADRPPVSDLLAALDAIPPAHGADPDVSVHDPRGTAQRASDEPHHPKDTTQRASDEPHHPKDATQRASDEPPFAARLVTDLQQSGYSRSGWRRFCGEAWRRSQRQRRAAPGVVRSLAWWLLGALVLGALVLAASAAPTAPNGEAGPLIADALVFAGCGLASGLFLFVHVGRVRRPGGHPYDRFGVPNGLSALRLLLAPLAAGPALRLAQAPAPWPALGVAFVGGLLASDILDGAWARLLDRRSELGRTLDPMADLALLTALTIGLWQKGRVPGWLFALLLVRFVAPLPVALALAIARGPRRLSPTLLGKAATLAAGAYLLARTAEALLAPHRVPLAWPSVEIPLGALLGLSLLVHARAARAWLRAT